DNFIYLRPELPATLTIRGAFPTFRHTQVDATLTGADAQLHWHVTEHLTWNGKASVLFARNQTADEYLVLMPADRFENELVYQLANWRGLQNLYLGASLLNVRTQDRAPENQDYAPPPDGYALVGLSAGFTVHAFRQPVEVGLSVSNLFDISYRDYLNRFRYYADEIGRNITVRLKVPFQLTQTPVNKHSS
ncbi:MAG: TonB-dependent receptor, partial [Bacteroidota bacterium]